MSIAVPTPSFSVQSFERRCSQMARLMWALVAQRILTDRQSNTVSYIEAVESLTTSRLPSALPPAVVGTTWLRDSEDDAPKIRFWVGAPSGEEVVTFVSATLDFRTHTRQRVDLDLRGMPINEAGRYVIRIDQSDGDQWRPEGEIPLEILFTPEESDGGDDDDGVAVE